MYKIHMQQIIASILPIFIITMLGKFIKIHWIKSKDFWKGLESLSYHLLFPIVLFRYISSADIGASSLLRIVLVLVLASIIISIILYLVQKKMDFDSKVFTSIFQGSIRYNSYIFFALGDSLFGDEGMVIASVIAAYMIIFTNIISVATFSFYIPMDDEIAVKRGESQWETLFKNLIKNPLILASLLGFIFNHFDIEISRSIQKTFSILSESALSIGILCVGSGLKFNLDNINFKAIFLTILMKLIAFPVISFILLKIMFIKGVPMKVAMLYSALPTATNSYLLSKKLGGDKDSMSSIITATIVFSVLSLSVLMYILK
jgi:malonate transporter and related proteins